MLPRFSSSSRPALSRKSRYHSHTPTHRLSLAHALYFRSRRFKKFHCTRERDVKYKRCGWKNRHGSRWNSGNTCTWVRWQPCSSTITSSCNSNRRSVYLCACLCVCLYVSVCMYVCMHAYVCAFAVGFPHWRLCADR
jgi:hypothetical protein